MPNKKTKVSKRRFGNKSSNFTRSPKEVSLNAFSYRGRVVYPSDRQEVKTSTEVLSYVLQVSSTGGGIIATVIGNSPNSCSQWSSFAGAYDEYRTLAVECIFQPYNYLGGGVIASGNNDSAPIYGVIDHDNATALTSASNATAYSSLVMGNTAVPFSVVARMASFDEATFINTSSPTSNFWIKYWAFNNISVSTTYGEFVVRMRVQFRGKGL